MATNKETAPINGGSASLSSRGLTKGHAPSCKPLTLLYSQLPILFVTDQLPSPRVDRSRRPAAGGHGVEKNRKEISR